MSLSKVCKMYGFTRRVIQGYEKEGLIKHTGRNKYGYLLYDEEEVKKIAYIRYLQINGLSLRKIGACASVPGSFISASILNLNNSKLEQQINKLQRLIKTNKEIMDICYNTSDLKEAERKVYEIVRKVVRNEKINKTDF